MRTLTLIRHAKSSWSDTSLSDFDRPLNKRGLDNAPLMGQLLQEQGVQFDRIISSPAVRAKTTAQLLARELGYPDNAIVYIDELYGAGINSLLDTVQSLPDDCTQVALVAHNPGLTEFCDYLCSAGISNMPTCSIAMIRLQVDTWAAAFKDTGTLERYEYPRKYTD